MNEVDYMDKILRALYLLRKNQIIQFYKLNTGKSGYSNSYVYAISHDCYPFFHSDAESEIYADCYEIKKSCMEPFIMTLDKLWQKEDYKTFYELEDMFADSPMDRTHRDEMIVILRYCFLDGRFNRKEFWDKITKQRECPCEAEIITLEFDSEEIY